jgi:hypothetical protein
MHRSRSKPRASVPAVRPVSFAPAPSETSGLATIDEEKSTAAATFDQSGR